MRRTRRQRRLSRKRGGANNNTMNINALYSFYMNKNKNKKNTNNNYSNILHRMYGQNENAFENNKKNNKVNCEAEGFNLDMRYATFGEKYKKSVGHIHHDAEKWSYEQLVDFTIDGRIIDWYIEELKKQGIDFTDEDIGRIKANKSLQILGAFYHRYKIVAERFSQAQSNFEKGVYHFLRGISRYNKIKMNTFVGKNSYRQFLEAQNISKGDSIKKYITKLSEFASLNFEGRDTVIELAIDRAQCLMFYIVKHKGNLPPGFVMDDRIKTRAEMPIDRGDPRSFMALKLVATVDWLEFLVSESDALGNPEVTFGVFDKML